MTNKKVAIPEPSMQTFLEWWKRYEVEKLTGLTERVQATYRSMYRRLLLWYFGSKNLGSIRKTDVRAWMTWAESQAGLERAARTHRRSEDESSSRPMSSEPSLSLNGMNHRARGTP